MVLLTRGLARCWWALTIPLRVFLEVRGSMTGASATLLVIGMFTLNIIWGYPWNGVFSACFSLMLVGAIINRVMRPHLDLNFTLPQSAPAGEPIPVVVHARNVSRLPALDLTAAFSSAAPSGNRQSMQATHDVLTPMCAIPIIESGEHVKIPCSLLFRRRGMHTLPDVRIQSFFPFHLFRSNRQHSSSIQIAITPRPLSGDEDAIARGLLNAFGGWSHKLLSGDALDYTGSREYRVGMPVRRWDFKSWARLGRPIVREFQSPSMQLVTILVDTAVVDSDMLADDKTDPALERVFSLAATAILSLTQNLIRVRLCITSEETESQIAALQVVTPTDCESLLIRLATARPVSGDVADDRLSQLVDQLGRTPTLLLTSRPSGSLPLERSSGVSVLRVDAAPETPVQPEHRTGKPKARVSVDA